MKRHALIRAFYSTATPEISLPLDFLQKTSNTAGPMKRMRMSHTIPLPEEKSGTSMPMRQQLMAIKILLPEKASYTARLINRKPLAHTIPLPEKYFRF